MSKNTKTAYSLLNASRYLFSGLDTIMSKNIFCAQTSHFYDSRGTFLGISSGDVNYPIEDSDVVALSKLILPIEDQRFFRHKGIDVKAIFRAVTKNIGARKIIQGGSTITQQVIRNTIIPYDKSLMRKIIEGILALAMEIKYSKQEILKLYFSHVYMGNGIRGFGAASKLICRKRLSEADDLDKCGLIGLVRLPNLTHPENHTNAYIRRRSYIKQHLKKNGVNIQEARERAVNPIKINRFKKPRFTNIVQHIVSNNKKIEFNEISKVYFTIDKSIQSAVDSVLRETSFEQNVKMVAGVLLENRTSNILCESAWCHCGKEAEYSPSYFGRIQPGSTFKPFALLSGLEQGFDLNSRFESAPFRSAIYKSSNNAPWIVRNYANRYFSQLNLLQALENSDNSVFARMTEHLDLIQLAYTYRQFNLWDSNLVHPSICLGALPSGVPLLRIASAYSALALNGAYREPNFIRGCLTQSGHLIPFKTQEFKIIADFKAVEYLKIALRHSGIQLTNLIFSGKTGTTKTGSLFAGYNDQVSLALWLDYKKALPESSPKSITSRNVVEKILNRLLGYRSGYLFEIG